MTTVSDFTALLSGDSWVAAPGLPTVITYSFETAPQDGLAEPDAFVDSFTALTSAQRNIARAALDDWAAVTGVIFVEVAAGAGDIRWGSFDFDESATVSGFAGFAYYPNRKVFETHAYDAALGGDIILDLGVTSFDVYLHEIGHAIGLKHPFSDDPLLEASLDNTEFTVMSYTDVAGGDGLGPFDIEAGQYLYGVANPVLAAGGAGLRAFAFDENAMIVAQVWGDGASQIMGTSLRDSVLAGGGNDLLAGIAGADSLSGGGGDDTAFGGLGNDEIYGGAGNDVLYGEEGVDFMGGGAGNDSLRAGDGDDTVYGGVGADTAHGGAGDDLIGGFDGDDSIRGNDGADALWGALGNDTVRGGEGSDTIGGSLGNDALYGDGGADEIWGAGGSDTILGGAGDDMMGASSGADVLSGEDGNDEMWGAADNDRLFGGNGNDRMGGGSGADTMQGGDGGDQMFGGSGGDLIFGQSGNDTIFGAGGDDTIDAGLGSDLVYGGAGGDTFQFRSDATSGQDTIGGFNAADGDILLLDRGVWGVGSTDAASRAALLGTNGAGEVTLTAAPGLTITLDDVFSTGDVSGAIFFF